MKALHYSIDEAVAAYQGDLGMDSDRYGQKIRRWIGQALLELRVHLTYSKEKVLPIINLATEVPDDFLKLDELVMINNQGACLTPWFEDSVIKCCLGKASGGKDKRVRASFNFDRFEFSSSITDLDIEKIRLRYFALPTKDSELVVPVMVNEAVRSYVKWQFLDMNRARTGDSRGKTGRVTGGDVQEAKRDWYATKKMAKSNLQNVNQHTLRQVGETYLYTLGIYPGRKRIAGE